MYVCMYIYIYIYIYVYTYTHMKTVISVAPPPFCLLRIVVSVPPADRNKLDE